jgi:hypothetical protein
MIHAIWKWLQLLLPYGLILHIYRHDKGLPANIKMQNGRCLKAIMITTDYGLLFSQEKYVDNRLKRLVAKQKEISHVNDLLIKEINELDFIQREKLLGNLRDEL